MPLLTLAEVSRRLGVHEQTARRITRDWPYLMVGGRKKFEQEVFQSYLRRACHVPVSRVTA